MKSIQLKLNCCDKQYTIHTIYNSESVCRTYTRPNEDHVKHFWAFVPKGSCETNQKSQNLENVVLLNKQKKLPKCTWTFSCQQKNSATVAEINAWKSLENCNKKDKSIYCPHYYNALIIKCMNYHPCWCGIGCLWVCPLQSSYPVIYFFPRYSSPYSIDNWNKLLY